MANAQHTAAGPGGHEQRDIDVRRVLMALAALTALIAATLALCYALLRGLEARPGAPALPLAAGRARPTPPEPRLQTDPRGDLQALREAEERALHGSGWADRSAGTVRIPIERAMALVAARGTRPRAERRP